MGGKEVIASSPLLIGELTDMVRLSLRAQSLYGRKIANSIKATEPTFNLRCSCPPGQSCSVEVNELSRRQFEVIVTRPAPVLESGDWSAMAELTGKYRRLFEKRATAERIAAFVSKMVGAPLTNGPQEKAEISPTPDIFQVDSAMLERVEKLILGCHMCSPFAEVPLFIVLDRLRNAGSAKVQYILARPPHCLRCKRPMTEHSLVDVEAPV